MIKNKTTTLLRDFLGILSLGLSIFILISLTSYSSQDPSFTTYATAWAEAQNRGGLVGAYCADGLAQTFGTGAFIFPLIIAVMGWGLIRWEIFSRWWVTLCFGTVFLIGLCALLGVQFTEDPFFSSAVESGGLVGSRLGEALVLWLNIVGAKVFLGTLLLISTLALAGVSANVVIEFSRKMLKAIFWKTGVVAGKCFLVLSRAVMGIKEMTARRLTTVRENRHWEKVNKTPALQPTIISQSFESKVDQPPAKKSREKKEEKEEFATQEDFSFMKQMGDYQIPPLSLLDDPPETNSSDKLKEEILRNAATLENKLADFGIMGRVVQVLPGPVITLYEFEPAPGIKVSRILSLSDDLALAMRAPSVRFLAPVPGKPVVGIELPNTRRDTVYLREIIATDTFKDAESKLALAVGKNNIGQPFVQDLAQVPHLLIAGSTGSGKSVGINTMVCSILLNATPDEVKMIMVDPKMLELSIYDGIPHLIAPVVTNPKKAAAALQWAVVEMENRYKVMAEKGVRNISSYNKFVERLQSEMEEEQKRKEKEKKIKKKTVVIDELADEENFEEPEEEKEEILEKFPYIVILIDELADLMMVASKGVEESLTRLAQMARASGIHLIVATQRPSVDVLTGIIKANFPARMSFQVTSRVDSRTILDSMGAEKLLGKGDMLFLPPGTSRLQRIHGAMVSDGEINRIVEFIKAQKKPEYQDDVFQLVADENQAVEESDEYDEKYDEALAFVTQVRQASISMVQRKFRVGYNRAARMIEQMERDGVVGPSDGAKPREVYAKPILFE